MGWVGYKFFYQVKLQVMKIVGHNLSGNKRLLLLLLLLWIWPFGLANFMGFTVFTIMLVLGLFWVVVGYRH